MKDEIKEILDYFRKYMSIKDCIKLSKIEDYITNLQEKVNQYENPDDMTLMFMWCDEKAKDKIKQLQEELKSANESITWWSNRFNALQEENKSLRTRIKTIKRRRKKQTHKKNIYKSRNKKAIEYCNYNDESLYTFEPDYDYEENMVDNYEPSNFREDLLNILNGDKDE